MTVQGGLAVVVGANRGLGLEVCKGLQKRGYDVIGACRKSSSELSAVPSIAVVEGVDIAAHEGCNRLVHFLSGRTVDLLMLVAGYQQWDRLGILDAEGLRKHFEVNAIGPILIVQALRPNLKPGSKVVFMSSKMGSCGDGRTGGGLYGYRMSKAALNNAGATLARDLSNDDIAVGLIHPGPVDTDMCRSVRAAMGVLEEDRSKNLMKPADSAHKVLEYVAALNMSNSGTYWAADTDEVLSW